MYLEMGTLDFVDAARGGYGCTNTAAGASNFADNGVSGISGCKIIKSGDSDRYLGLWGQLHLTSGADNTPVLKGIEGAYYSFTEMMEA